jgi:hypothetical protein
MIVHENFRTHAIRQTLQLSTLVIVNYFIHDWLPQNANKSTYIYLAVDLHFKVALGYSSIQFDELPIIA